MAAQRLQKFLAAAGIASRRASEALIRAGRVAVNGTAVRIQGVQVDPEVDAVTVDGQPVRPSVKLVYYALNKPPGYVTTASDEQGRPTVLDLLPEGAPRVFPVGRLDLMSEGLLLLTNDGALTHRLTHPRYGIEREYRALLSGEPNAEGLALVRRGTVVEGRQTRARVWVERALPGEPRRFWLRVVLREGRKREVREICRTAGYPVERLIRVRYGPVELKGLPAGVVRPLGRQEVQALYEATELRSGLRRPLTNSATLS